MFGYVVPNEQELKLYEYDEYRSCYCGLCRALRDRYGAAGQMTLSYDLTFLSLLLESLYEPDLRKEKIRCAVHPGKPHPTRRSSFTDYAADMNILLTYYSCLDDWKDEKDMKKRALARALKKKAESVMEAYPQKAAVIRESLEELGRLEQAGCKEPDLVSGCFGRVLSEVFAVRSDEWEARLRTMGFYLGKFLYLMDAYDDLEKDLEKGCYNPFRALREDPSYEEKAHAMMTMMMAECSAAFEQLPILNDLAILRNILYSGVWSRYDAVQRKRQAETPDDQKGDA